MRITDNMMLSSALENEALASQRMYKLSKVASSGEQVNAPSDDAATFGAMVSLDGRLSVLQSRSQGATRASGDLNIADGALSSAADIMVRAKEIALEAANGSMDPASRADAAIEVSGLQQQLISLANTKGASGYIFGGTKTDTPPMDASGNFVGNDNVTHIEVADGMTAATNVSGARAFTAVGGRNVVGDLQALATALGANDLATIQASAGQLDTSHDQIVAVQVDAGVASDRLQSSSDVISSAILAGKTERANEADANVPQVYSELSMAQTSYQSAISVTKQILSLSAFQGNG
jgi:flagellar hook-associated protein 3 FlgL